MGDPRERLSGAHTLFKIGDKVIHIATLRLGTIVKVDAHNTGEADWDYVYVNFGRPGNDEPMYSGRVVKYEES